MGFRGFAAAAAFFRRRRRRLWLSLWHGESDDPAGESSPRVSGDLALLTAAFAQIVLVGVDDHGAAQDARLAVESDSCVFDPDFGVAGAIRLEVPEIAGVAVVWAVFGGAVFRSVGIKVRSGRRASIGVVAELVDVEAVESLLQPIDFSRDLDRAIGSFLRQTDDALDGLAGQDANGVDRHDRDELRI